MAKKEELMVLRPQTTELSTRAQMMAELEEGEKNAHKVVIARVKMPSGGAMMFQFEDDGKRDFMACILAAQISRAFWPKMEEQGMPPVCSSPDGLVGYLNAPVDPELRTAAETMYVRHPWLDSPGDLQWPCATCPMSMFVGGQRPACKELRRMVISIVGSSLPVIFTLPPSSIGIFDKYASMLKGQGERYFSVWTKFSLEPATSKSGIKFAKVVLEKAGPLAEDDLGYVLELRKRYIGQVQDTVVEAVEGTEASISDVDEDDIPF